MVSGWNQSHNPSLLNSVDFEEFVQSFPGGTFRPRRQTLYNLSAEVSQPLFTWGKVGAALDLAESVAEVTEAQIDTTRLDVAAEAAEAYFELLRALEARQTLEVQRRTRAAALEVVEARFELGDATRLELLRSQASLASLEPEAARSSGAVEVARSRLRRILGLGLEAEIDVAPPLAPLPDPPPLPDLAVLAARRPEVLDLERQQESLGHRIRV
ncbi:MAG: TolC family protein, partial [Acidobacteria bacterium]|nr:TolC family protein [Acidobacteriota bacterium]